jgi:hypothetical protein
MFGRIERLKEDWTGWCYTHSSIRDYLNASVLLKGHFSQSPLDEFINGKRNLRPIKSFTKSVMRFKVPPIAHH